MGLCFAGASSLAHLLPNQQTISTDSDGEGCFCTQLLLNSHVVCYLHVLRPWTMCGDLSTGRALPFANTGCVRQMTASLVWTAQTPFKFHLTRLGLREKRKR